MIHPRLQYLRAHRSDNGGEAADRRRILHPGAHPKALKGDRLSLEFRMELGQSLHHHDMVLETPAIHVGDEAREVDFRAAQTKARNQVKDSNHSSSTRAFAVLSAKESILN